jgi:hypothetical protein
MSALKDLFASEHGFFALALIICATVLVGIGKMPVGDWQTLATTVFGLYVGSNTVTGAVTAFRSPNVIAASQPAPTSISITEAPKPA